MGYKKPKEKKSRLKDLEDLIDPDILEKLFPKEEPKKEIPEGLKDLLKKRFKDRDFWDKLKPVPLPKYAPDPRYKPVPLPKMIPPYELDPSLPKPVPMPLWPPRDREPQPFKPKPMPDGFLWPPRDREPQPFKPPRFDPERGPDPKYRELPKLPRFDPERGPDPRYWAEAGDEGKHSYSILGRPVTKEEYDAEAEVQKERGIIFGDISELTFKSQKLYDMKLEQLDLPKGSHLPMDEHIELMDALRRLDEKLGKGTYIHNPEDPIRSLESFANGGIMDINAMTAPLGYEHGGDVSLDKIMADMEASEGPGEQGTISKAIYKLAGDPVIDPMFTAKEKIKDFGRTGIETLKELGSGAMGVAQKLLGAGPAEAKTKEEAIIELEAEIFKLQLEEMYQGLDHSKAITSIQNSLDYYRKLK